MQESLVLANQAFNRADCVMKWGKIPDVLISETQKMRSTRLLTDSLEPELNFGLITDMLTSRLRKPREPYSTQLGHLLLPFGRVKTMASQDVLESIRRKLGKVPAKGQDTLRNLPRTAGGSRQGSYRVGLWPSFPQGLPGLSDVVSRCVILLHLPNGPLVEAHSGPDTREVPAVQQAIQSPPVVYSVWVLVALPVIRALQSTQSAGGGIRSPWCTLWCTPH